MNYSNFKIIEIKKNIWDGTHCYGAEMVLQLKQKVQSFIASMKKDKLINT